MSGINEELYKNVQKLMEEDENVPYTDQYIIENLLPRSLSRRERKRLEKDMNFLLSIIQLVVRDELNKRDE